MSNAFHIFVNPPSRPRVSTGCDLKSQNGGHDGLMEASLIFFMRVNIKSLSWFLSLLMGHVPCNSPMNCVFAWRFLTSHFSSPWTSFLWLLMISGLFLRRVPLIPSWTSLEVFRQRLETGDDEVQRLCEDNNFRENQFCFARYWRYLQKMKTMSLYSLFLFIC